MENKIKEVLDGLVAGIEEGIYDEYSDVIEQLLTAEYLDWKDPDNINVMYFYETTKFIPQLLKRVYQNVDAENMSRICFIYEHYDFVNNSVRNLVDMGYGCCADKTRWLISQYLKKCLGEELKEIPCWNSKEHHYAHPDFGVIGMWMDYIEALYHMFYRGCPSDVSNIYEKLSRRKNDVRVLIGEENKKINSFYNNFDVLVKGFFDAGMLEFETVSRAQKLEISRILRDDIVNGSLDTEKILKVIKENV